MDQGGGASLIVQPRFNESGRWAKAAKIPPKQGPSHLEWLRKDWDTGTHQKTFFQTHLEKLPTRLFIWIFEKQTSNVQVWSRLQGYGQRLHLLTVHSKISWGKIRDPWAAPSPFTSGSDPQQHKAHWLTENLPESYTWPGKDCGEHIPWTK